MIFEPSVKFEVPGRDYLSWAFALPKENEDEPILVDADNPVRKVSRPEAKTVIRQLAAGLDHIGVKPGQCILLHALNDFHTFLLAFGCVAVGAIFSPAPFGAPEHELSSLMKTGGADWVFTDAQSFEKVTRAATAAGISQDHIGVFNPSGRDGVPQQTGLTYQSLLQRGEKDWIRFDDFERARNQVILRPFTSGSTGPPKAADIAHTYFTNMAIIRLQADRSKPFQVRLLQQAPLNHITGWYMAFQILAGVGVIHVTHSVDMSDWIDFYEKFNITEVIMPPGAIVTMCDLVEAGTKPKSSIASLKMITSVGSPLQASLVKRVKTVSYPDSIRVTSGYGSTEAGGMMAWPWPDEDITPPISTGVIIPNVELKLFDPDAWTEIDDHDTLGEFCIRSSGLFKGYYNNEAATANTFYTDKDGKWYKTGDVGYYSSAKKTWVLVGRSKENFKLHGRQIAPTEIEDVLTRHESIIDAAVGPSYTDGRVTGTRAWIVAKDETLTQADVMDFLQDKLMDLKRPHGGVKFVSQIPRSSFGKLIRSQLAEL